MICPRCGAAALDSQEYCLECGVRLPVRGRFSGAPTPEGRRLLPLAITLLAAAGGAVAAIAATHDDAAPPPPVVLTGGSVPVPKPRSSTKLAVWPAGTDAWTIVLASIPKSQGVAPARAIAVEAKHRRLVRVGILDSGRHASLHPGYWMVFTGLYTSQPEATGALEAARAVSKTARVQRVA